MPPRNNIMEAFDMKRIIAAVLCLCSAAFFLFGCSGGGAASGTSGAQIANPFEEYETLEQAQKAVGFEITVPEEINGCGRRIFRVNKENHLLEIIYQDNDGEKTYTVRKAEGDGDISGDYNKYAYSDTSDGITVKGEDASACALAVWAKGDYAYSVSAGSALSREDMLALAGAVE